MKIIVCLDESNGMAFNNRRQSRDRVVIEDIIKITSGSRLLMKEYSEDLFEEYKYNITVDSEFLRNAGRDDYCFIETDSILGYEADICEIVIYNWNRKYPKDRSFNMDLNEFKLCSTEEFGGKSHEKITKNVYKK